MRVLGVDPGLSATGYAVVTDEDRALRALVSGTVRPDPHQPLPQRLGQIHQELSALLRQWEPEGLALEEVYLGRNAPSAMATAQVVGVVLLLAQGLLVFTYAPRQVKKWICGSGKAPKEQVVAMVAHLLGQDGWESDHAADAAAVAICALLEAER